MDPNGPAFSGLLINGASIEVDGVYSIRDASNTYPISGITTTTSVPSTNSNVRITNGVFRDYELGEGLNIPSGDVTVRNCLILNNYYGLQLRSFCCGKEKWNSKERPVPVG